MNKWITMSCGLGLTIANIALGFLPLIRMTDMIERSFFQILALTTIYFLHKWLKV